MLSIISPPCYSMMKLSQRDQTADVLFRARPVIDGRIYRHILSTLWERARMTPIFSGVFNRLVYFTVNEQFDGERYSFYKKNQTRKKYKNHLSNRIVNKPLRKSLQK